MIYKVISLLQPWASLVVLGHKRIETRSWNTKHRGPLLIHASLKFTKEQERLAFEFSQLLKDSRVYHGHRGAIIGSVELDGTMNSESFFLKGEDKSFGCEITEQEKLFGNYSPKRYGWLLSDPVLFDEPIPVAGGLSLWDFDMETKQKVTKKTLTKQSPPLTLF